MVPASRRAVVAELAAKITRGTLVALLVLCGLSACNTEPAPLRDLTVAEARQLGNSGLRADALVKGYLAYWPYATGARLVLYATEDDAKMRNVPASVLVSVPNDAAVGSCVEHFVQVRGTAEYSEQNQSAWLAHLEFIAPLDPTGGSSGFDQPCFQRN